jgi:hypothetical protein
MEALNKHVQAEWPVVINTTKMYNFPLALGLFPWIIPMSDSRPAQRGTFRNNGLPWLANLTAHAKVLRAQVAAAIPDPDFGGACIIDYEEWAPVWPGDGAEFGRWSGVCGQGGIWDGPCGKYRNASMDYVQTQHPTWTEQQVETTARQLWVSGATAFLRTTLLAARSVRPHCAWGLYGYPPRDQNGHGGSSMHAGNSIADAQRALNDATVPVLAASSGFFPSLYTGVGTGESGVVPGAVADFVGAVMNETKRVRAAAAVFNGVVSPTDSLLAPIVREKQTTLCPAAHAAVLC